MPVWVRSVVTKGFAAGAVALVCLPLAAAAAPNALIGKSVTVSWNETRSQRDVGEPAFKPVSIPYTFTVYFGTGGHVFKRIFAVAASRRASGADDKVGGGGGANVSFSGNTLVGTNSFGGAARRIQVTFDGGFSSCSAQVVTAKLAGAKTATVKSIATGGMVEFESVSAGSATCSIAQGNPFAN
jgi:hypothetical protein